MLQLHHVAAHPENEGRSGVARKRIPFPPNLLKSRGVSGKTSGPQSTEKSHCCYSSLTPARPQYHWCCRCLLSSHSQHTALPLADLLLFLLIALTPMPRASRSPTSIGPSPAMSWLLAVAVVAGFAVDLSAATDHIVGANHGWNPNINYSLWSGNQTFYVGDLICKSFETRTPCRSTSVFS